MCHRPAAARRRIVFDAEPKRKTPRNVSRLTPTGLYHAESVQEDFLVLTGECVLIIEGPCRRRAAAQWSRTAGARL